MRVSEIRVKRIRVNQGLGVVVLITSCGAISEQNTNWLGTYLFMQIAYQMMLGNVIPDNYIFSRDNKSIL